MELCSTESNIETNVEQNEKSVKSEEALLQELLKKVAKRKRKKDEDQKNNTNAAHKDLSNPKKAKDIHNNDVTELENNLEQMENVTECNIDENVNNNENTNFQILGEEMNDVKKSTVKMILPYWLAHPEIISTCISESTETVDEASYLSTQVKNSLKRMNIVKLFPVQTVVIPNILRAHSLPPPIRPRDICVSVPTGSGKTLAFAIPIVQLLNEEWTAIRKVRALIILPVGELALQVFKVFKQLCDNTKLNVCLLSTQNTLRAEQEKLLEFYKAHYYSKVDIIVTTPGRLVDHLHSTKGFCLKSLKFLVIDEADRIMEDNFQNWTNHLDNHVKSDDNSYDLGFFREPPLCFNALEMTYGKQPHKMLFSATLSPDPEKLHNLGLFQPQHFTSSPANLDELYEKYVKTIKIKVDQQNGGDFVENYVTPAELNEKYCLTESRLKPLTLFALIMTNQWSKFLCFTNSVESSGRLTYVLKYLFRETNDIKIAELSASLKAKQRSNILSLLERNKINGVICSDALARGIDVPNVDVIISYDPPRHVKTYIHRVGRTARAGRSGTAITLLNEKELETFNNMLMEVGRILPTELTISIDVEVMYANQYKSALTALRHKIIKDKRISLLKKERVKEQQQAAASLHTTNHTEMTLTEKLQQQATEQIYKMASNDENDKMLSSKKNPSKKSKLKNQKKKKTKTQNE